MKTKFQSSFLFLLILLAFSLAGFSQTKYYLATVAQGGNDLNNGTSLSTPFATIGKALLAAIVPGDTIFVRSGTYITTTTAKIIKPGTAAKHIVLTVYQPDMINANSRPVFDFSSMTAGSSNRGFTLTGANYWDIYGIIIKGAGDNGMNVSASSYTKIEFCSFLRNRDTGLQLGNLSHHVTIINCDAYENADLGAGTTTLGGNADGFAPKIDVGDTIIFRGCRAWMNSDDGWDGYLRTPAGVPDNMTTFLEDCWAFRNGYYWLDGSTNSEQNGNGFKMGGSDNKDLAHNFVLTKCLAFYNKTKGFDQNSNAGSIYLYNNSAYKNLGNDYGLTSSTAIYKPGAELVLKNNMSLGSAGVSIPSASTPTRTLITATNVFSSSTTNPEILSYDTTGVTGMRSIDGSLPNLNFMHLNAAYAGPYTYINKGTILPDVSYHGTTGVPYSGSTADIGAFESNAGAVPVQMLYFTQVVRANVVTLMWKTSFEINNKGWTIQRSGPGDSTSWIDNSFLPGLINSSSAKEYSYQDRPVFNGTYYYRLRQTDMDGKISYSEILPVTLKLKPTGKLKVYPNPGDSFVMINYTLSSAMQVQLNIYSLTGEIALQILNNKQTAGEYKRMVPIRALAAGKYQIILTYNGRSYVAEFIKL